MGNFTVEAEERLLLAVRVDRLRVNEVLRDIQEQFRRLNVDKSIQQVTYRYLSDRLQIREQNHQATASLVAYAQQMLDDLSKK